MTKISILLALLLQLCTMIHGTPCSQYYSYASKFGANEILGQIEIPSPPSASQYHIKVGFNTNDFLPFKEPIARLDRVNPSAQGPLKYDVYFPEGQPIPRVTKIWLNSQQICPSPEEKETYKTTKEIEDGRPSAQESSTSANNSLQGDTSPNTINNIGTNNVFPRPVTTLRPQNDNTSISPNITTNSDECGITTYSDLTNLLMTNGEETKPGQWPWLVALFAVMKDYKFKCAGSILTTKHVITAAHCLKLGIFSNDTLHPNVLVVVLGRFNLHHWHERGTLNREVEKYTIHPDYAHADSADSDLAIIKLRTHVEYSVFIKPICLWSGPITLQDVVSRTGYVVGWGQDVLTNLYTEDPRMARVPIVSHETCLWSDLIFVKLTSERTLCAGLRDQVGPCNGDSGSGLVLYNISTGRYQLRAVVSRSVTGDDYLCDLKKYVVYVDVAKYLPWIREQIADV